MLPGFSRYSAQSPSRTSTLPASGPRDRTRRQEQHSLWRLAYAIRRLVSSTRTWSNCKTTQCGGEWEASFAAPRCSDVDKQQLFQSSSTTSTGQSSMRDAILHTHLFLMTAIRVTFMPPSLRFSGRPHSGETACGCRPHGPQHRFKFSTILTFQLLGWQRFHAARCCRVYVLPTPPPSLDLLHSTPQIPSKFRCISQAQNPLIPFYSYHQPARLYGYP